MNAGSSTSDQVGNGNPQMQPKPNAQSAEADLAFLRSIVEGDQRPPMTLAI